ncbi:MAG: DNA polymerase III subunit delta [Chitinophagales bacterium]|nr:DNA polymerase III subunit delta [Chitinophagales bacterium]
MKFETLRSEIKAGKYHPLYLLHGEESYYIDEIVDLLESSVLSESEKSFNFTVFYGKDTNAIQIMEASRRLPMMAPVQLVIVKEAQYLRDITTLESYLNHIVPSTILVIVHKNKKADGRKKVFKAMEKKGVTLYSKRISERVLPDWIQSYVEDKGYSIESKATQVLAQYLGTDLSKVANELSKLFINKKKGEVIDSDDIEKNIGISKDYNVFEFQDALGNRDISRSYKIMDYMIDNQKNNPFPVIIGTLYGYFSKAFVLSKFRNPDKEIYSQLSIPPFFQSKFKAACINYSSEKLEETMIDLGKYDLRSKGVDNRNIQHAELLKELVYKILH